MEDDISPAPVPRPFLGDRETFMQHLSATIDPRMISAVREDLESARQEVLRGIVNSDTARRALSELLKSDTFKPMVGARMYRGTDGLYLGHIKGADGKFIGNVRWEKISGVGSRLLISAGMISGHLMLVEISNKIDRVQKDVRAIREALNDDRMQNLRAAIDGVHSAFAASFSENRHALVMATIPNLRSAVQQTIAALKREIFAIPERKSIIPFINREKDTRLGLSST